MSERAHEITLTEPERRFHQGLLDHARAPIFNFTSTDLLTPRSLADVRRFEMTAWERGFWRAGQHPDWLTDFVARCHEDVPFYRAQGKPPRAFESLPTFDRSVLHSQPWSLVPDSMTLDALTVYTTSGTSGTTAAVPTDPAVSSKLLVLLEHLLATRHVALPRGPGRVAIALVACQQETLTYASVSHALDGAGFLKLNLAPHAWREPSHRSDYLKEAAPAVLTGSPHAFEVLAEAVPELRPQAMVSSAVALHPGQQKRLEQVFGCPVFDFYSMTEARALAGRSDVDDDLMLLAPDLYVEILGARGEPAPLGEVGEIVITGGRNSYLPLLRYRTGDRAALVFKNSRPYLSRFEGRQAVHLEMATGRTVPTLDVVHALKSLPLVGFSLEQAEDRSLRFRYSGQVAEHEVSRRLGSLFGTEASVEKLTGWEGKPQRFSSRLSPRPSAL